MSVFYNNLEQTLVYLHNDFENVSNRLPNENSRIFPGSYEKPPFFKESQALKEKSKNSRISRFSRWRTNPEYTVKFAKAELCMHIPVIS